MSRPEADCRPRGAAIRGAGDEPIGFDVDAFRKHCLQRGLDDIGLTLQHVDEIGPTRARRQSGPVAVVLTPAGWRSSFDFNRRERRSRLGAAGAPGGQQRWSLCRTA